MERKSGIPELVEMPAPVTTRMRLLEWIVSAIVWSCRWLVDETVVVGIVGRVGACEMHVQLSFCDVLC